MSDRTRLEQAIIALESQRANLGEEVVSTMITAAREKLAALDHAKIGDLRQLVTILFADISGFTALAGQIDAEDVQDLLHRLWKQLDGVILSYDGHIDKHIGDAVMAVWGLEQAREEDVYQAVGAALALQRELVAFNKHLPFSQQLHLRVGLNTGVVSISQVASTGERNIIGDTVNLASRLEHLAPTNGILLSQSSYDQVRGLFDVRPQPLQSVKGKTEKIASYLVLKKKPRAFHMSARGLAGVSTRTIGRDDELVRLQSAYQQARSTGGLHWLTVSGEAGVGKSRLLLEFEHWLELQSEEIWLLKARAWPETRRTPYFLLRNLLSYRFDIRDGDALEVARKKLLSGMRTVMGEGKGEEAAAFIGQLLGFDFSQHQLIANVVLDTHQVLGRSHALFHDYFDILCGREPVVMLLEDLHWADRESLDFIASILTRGEKWHLCVIGLTRPSLWERDIRWGQQTGHQHVELSPLTGTVGQQLVYELLKKIKSPPDWLVELLLERGEGNPYFTEELVHWLIEQGVIYVTPDTWQVNPMQAVGLSVPATIQGVLQARIEQLNPLERVMLQQASVIGRAFWHGAVEYMSKQPTPVTHWQQLQQRDLIYPQAKSQLPGEIEYLFKHALLRDVIYEFTLKRERRVFHERAAEWLVQQTADRIDEWAAVIADHYERAEQWLVAAEWFGKAGRKATYSPLEAIHYYQKGLALLPETIGEIDASLRLTLHESLAEVLGLLVKHEEAMINYQRMREIAAVIHNVEMEAYALNRLAMVQDVLGQHYAVLETATQTLALLQASGLTHSRQQALALSVKGLAYSRLGNMESALNLFEQALALSRKLEAVAEIAYNLNLLASVAHTMGRHYQAETYWHQALEIYQSRNARRIMAVTYHNLANSARSRGDYETALIRFKETLASLQAIGDRRTEIHCRGNLGATYIGLGNYTLAEQELRQAIQMGEEINWYALAEHYSYLTLAYAGQSKLEMAQDTARHALQLVQQTGSLEFTGLVWYTTGVVAAQTNEPVEIGAKKYDAAACFQQSNEYYIAISAAGGRARTLRAWAEYEGTRGNRQKARELWQQAIQIFTELEMDLELTRMEVPPF